MMHPLVILMLIASSSCLAHYGGGYGSRNLVEREERLDYDGVTMVECPVCLDTPGWLPNDDNCPIVKGDKRYKKCERGVYINDVCGNRLDCYRGPGEKCTEKQEFDMLGQKCAPGYYCNKPLGVCTGRDFVIDSTVQWLVNTHPYHHDSASRSVFKGRDNTKIDFGAIRN